MQVHHSTLSPSLLQIMTNLFSQSRTTASTNSRLKGRKKTGIDSVRFVYVCIYVMYMCVYRMFQPWYIATEDSKGSHNISQDDDSLRTSAHSGVKKRTGK